MENSNAVVLTPGAGITYVTLAAGTSAVAAAIGAEKGQVTRLAELPGIPKREGAGALKFYGRRFDPATNTEPTIVLPSKDDEGNLDVGGAVGFGTIVVAAETDDGARREFTERERQGIDTIFPNMMGSFTLLLAGFTSLAGGFEPDAVEEAVPLHA